MSLTRKSVLVTSASIAAAIISYLYNPLLIAPRLGPEGIAVLGSFLALNFALSFPQRPLSVVLVRQASKLNAEGNANGLRSLMFFYLHKLSFWGLILCFALLLSSSVIAKFLNLTTPLPIFAAILQAYAALLLAIFWSFLQGMMRFGQYSLSLFFDPLIRLVAGMVFIFAGLGELGSMFGYVAGVSSALTVCLWFLKDLFTGKDFAEKVKKVSGHAEGQDWRVQALQEYSVPVWIFSFYLAFEVSMDGLMVKHYFPDAQAGIYMAASTLAKILLIVINPISAVSYSMMCNHAARNENILPLLFKTLLITFLGGAAVVAVAFFLAPAIINITYGSQFADAASLLPYACLAFFSFSLVLIYSNYCLARKKHFFIYGLIAGSVLQVFLIMTHHNTLTDVLLAFTSGGLSQLVFAVLSSFLEFRNEKKLTQ